MATTLTTFFPFDAGAGADVTESGWRDMARHWLQTGVLDGEDSEFVVSERAAGANMSVDVATGKCWIRGHYGAQTSVVNLAIATADATNPRIDRVVLRADFSANRIELDVLTGTPDASPAEPSLTQSTSRWEISLAQVSVPASDTAVADAQITDERTLVVTDLSGTYEELIDRTGATAGEVPILQGDGSLAFGATVSDAIPQHLPAAAMGPINASPTLSNVSGNLFPVWLLDASVIEAVGGTIEVPSGWATAIIDLYWTNVGAGSGNVKFRFRLDNVADAGDLTTGDTPADATVAAPAQNVLKVSSTSAIAVTSAGITGLSIYRLATDGADTLANDVGVLALVLRKAS